MLRKHLNLPNLLFFREKQDQEKRKKEEDCTDFLYEARKRERTEHCLFQTFFSLKATCVNGPFQLYNQRMNSYIPSYCFPITSEGKEALLSIWIPHVVATCIYVNLGGGCF